MDGRELGQVQAVEGIGSQVIIYTVRLHLSSILLRYNVTLSNRQARSLAKYFLSLRTNTLLSESSVSRSQDFSFASLQ